MANVANVSMAMDVAGVEVQRLFLNFLETYSVSNDAESGEPQPSYLRVLQDMKDAEHSTLHVNFEHVQEFESDLAMEAIMEQYYRFEPYLRKAVQNFVTKHHPEYVEDDNGKKEFFVAFNNMPSVLRLRELKTEKIGRLVSFSATVTRTSEVRPELLFGEFQCGMCGTEVKDVEQQCKYTTPTICPNPTCNNRKAWRLSRDGSKFVDWQRVRCQENADEVPAGSLPRSIDVILRHETVEHARAGDKCTFTGTLMVIPETAPANKAGDRVELSNAGGRTAASEGVTGLRQNGVRELHYRMVFLAHSVQSATNAGAHQANVREEEGAETPMAPEELEEVRSMALSPTLYEDLVHSVAPAVFGHADVKRAVLLMLFGGVHKTTHEGIQLRGDINVAIIGDPSCAKSQFLKYVASFLPRAVYTSGKSSSAAGLTATVVKDPETGDYAIEAGALMLADNGICCIDEFDKMDPKDQVAIHEAMEQQTISVAKAGINATLNARTSILAAANPAGGRYDKSKPLKANLQLPPAILSRFDLVHIMLDEPDDVKDYNIARHIVGVHQRRDQALSPPYSTEQLQRYIRYSRSLKPEMTAEAQAEAVRSYVRLRTGDAHGGQTAYRITVRQLEALIRLSEALARLHNDPKVRAAHVREAKRLLGSSIISVEAADVSLSGFDDEEEGPFDDADAPDAPGGGGDDGDGDGGDGGDGGGDEAMREAAGEGRPESRLGRSQADGATQPEGATQPGASHGPGGDGAGGKAPAQLTVSHDKFVKVKDMLALRLRQLAEEAVAAEEAAGGAARAEEEGAGGAGEAEGSAPAVASLDSERLHGVTQKALIQWYIEEESGKGMFSSTQEMADEVKLIRTIIAHLIKKEAIIMVVEEPLEEEAPPADEVPRDKARRRARMLEGRKLALDPNYVF